MQYAGLNGMNLMEMTQAERDRLMQTHLSLGSIKTVEPNISVSEKKLVQSKSSRSNKSKSSIKSKRSSKKSVNNQEWDLSGHRIKRSTTKSSMKRTGRGGSKASISTNRQASFSKSR